MSDITPSLARFAPLNSPHLVGNPTAPTASSTDNSTTVATTALVQAVVAASGGGGGGGATVTGKNNILSTNVSGTALSIPATGTWAIPYGATMVVAGDSNSAPRGGNTDWPYRFAHLPEIASRNITLVNTAVAGRKLQDLITAYPSEVRPYAPNTTNIPAYLIVNIGINDVQTSSAANPTGYLFNLTGYYFSGVSDGFKVVGCTIPAGVPAGSLPSTIVPINYLIRHLDYTALSQVVDLNALLNDDTDLTWYDSDNLHYEPAYGVVAQKVAQDITSFGGDRFTNVPFYDKNQNLSILGNLSLGNLTILNTGVTSGTTVSFSGASAGQSLTYNAVNKTWSPGNISGGTYSNLFQPNGASLALNNNAQANYFGLEANFTVWGNGLSNLITTCPDSTGLAILLAVNDAGHGVYMEMAGSASTTPNLALMGSDVSLRIQSNSNLTFGGQGATDFLQIVKPYNVFPSVSINCSNSNIGGGNGLSPVFVVNGTTIVTGLIISSNLNEPGGVGSALFVNGPSTFAGNATITNSGSTLSVKGGSNCKAGTFTVTGGAATVSNTSITANSVIVFTVKTASGTVGLPLYVTSTSVGTSFTVAGGTLDNSTYNYVILEQN